jgi:hypothetical protein
MSAHSIRDGCDSSNFEVGPRVRVLGTLQVLQLDGAARRSGSIVAGT